MQSIVAKLPELVNESAAILRHGRYLTTDWVLGVDGDEYVVRVREGRIAGVDGPGLTMPAGTFALRASAAAWQAFWQPVPKPGYHDLIAMKRIGELRMEGDIRLLMAYLFYLKMVLESPRSTTVAEGA